MAVKDLVEKVAAVVGGQLGVPDQPVQLPHAQGLHRVLAVVHPEPGLEVDGVLLLLVPDEEHQLLALQQGAQVQALQMGAEYRPVRVMQVDVVVPAHPLAGADAVVQVLQLVLGVHVPGQDGLFQVVEKAPAHHRTLEIYVIPKAALRRVVGHKAVIVVGIEPQGQEFKVNKVLPEQIRVLFQQLAVVLVPGFQQLRVGLVKGLCEYAQAVLPELPPAVQADQGGIAHLVVPAVLEYVQRGLQLLLWGLGLVQHEAVGLDGPFGLVHRRQLAGNFDCSHDVISFRWV